MTTYYYYTIDSILNCTRVALVYAKSNLIREDIPKYSIWGTSLFEPVIVINIDENKEFHHYFKDKEKYNEYYYKYNYLLYLDDNSNVIGFVKFDSPIDFNKVDIYHIQIIFKNEVSFLPLIQIQFNIDYVKHEKDIDKVHKSPDEVKGKARLSSLKNDRSPFDNNLINQLNDDYRILKYSNRIVKKGSIMNGLAFNMSDIDGEIIGISKYNSEFVVVVRSDDGYTKMYDQGGYLLCNTLLTSKPITVNDDYILFDNEDKTYTMFLLNPYDGVNQLVINKSISDEFDTTQGRTLHYCINPLNHQVYFYRTAMHKDGDADKCDVDILEIYSDSKLIDIINTVYQGKKLEYEILYAMNTMLVYNYNDEQWLFSFKMKCEGNGDSEDLMIMDKPDMINWISDECFLYSKDGVHTLYELNNLTGAYRWIKKELGKDGFLRNIRYITHSIESNPFVKIMSITYHGNLFGYKSNEKLLVSL